MPQPSLDQIITEIEQWFSDTMHNSIVSREVAVYNHVQGAYEELKSRIAALVTGKPAPAAAQVAGAAAPQPDAEASALSDPKSKAAI